MLALTFYACLIGSTVDCRDVRLIFDAASVTPYQCMMRGQTQMARWIMDHPRYEVRRIPETGAAYTCGPVRELRARS